MVCHSIGTKGSAATEIFRRHGITPLRDILSPQLFASIPHKAPSPKAILIPQVVFWLMACACLYGTSMTGAPGEFRASLRAAVPGLPMRVLTEEAFCKARGKLPLGFFLRLFHKVICHFSRNYNQRWRWCGHRLLGIDGTEATLPREGGKALREKFPPPSNQHGSAHAAPQARLVGLVGLFDGLCYAFRWTSRNIGEQACALRLMRFLKPLDLLLADRNFPGLAIFAAVLAQKADFLLRLPAKRLPSASKRMQEWHLELPLPKALRRQYPQLPKCPPVRVLEYQRPGFRVSWLITSLLDIEVYPYEEVVSLYRQRWRQETWRNGSARPTSAVIPAPSCSLCMLRDVGVFGEFLEPIRITPGGVRGKQSCERKLASVLRHFTPKRAYARSSVGVIRIGSYWNAPVG